MLVSEIPIGSEAGFRVPMFDRTEIKAERATSSRRTGGGAL
jgi:hypothetical protein